jgi:hypothetical protein
MDYILDKYGSKCTYLNGKLHSYNDKPAIIYPNVYRAWYKEGRKHREDGPAIIYSDGDQYWLKEGKKHREDGPAVILSNGSQYWFKKNKLHREDGPAVIHSNEYQVWFKEDKLHRDEVNSLSFVLPAVINANGHAEWWIDGVKIKECENYRPQIKSSRN